MKFPILTKLVGLTGSALLLASCSTGDGENSGGGEAAIQELRIAYASQPATLDGTVITAPATRDISRNALESLVALDSEGEVHGVLAESWEEHEDGSITFTLRDDVTFHDGSEMTSADVVASLERAFALQPRAQQYFGDATVAAEDDYTVTLTVPEPVMTMDLLLGAVQTFIMPAEVLDDAPPEGVHEIIGTGPYKLVEWAADRYVHFEIFEDYVPKHGPDEGVTGDRTGTYENIYFEFVPDASTRVNGIIAGEYDLATEIPYDNVDRINADGNVEIVVGHGEFLIFVYNKAEGLMADETMRKALWNAIDVEEVLMAAFSNEQFYNMNGSLVSETSPWWTDAGLDGYGERDLEEAERLLEEAGYDGEPVRLVASQEYPYHYDAAIMVEQQLAEIGVNVDLIVPDWPTLLEMRDDPGAYELFVTHSTPALMPIYHTYLYPEWAGWTNDEAILGAIERVVYGDSEDQAFEAVEDLQEAFYDYLPAMKFGEMSHLVAVRQGLDGFEYIPEEGDIFYRVHPTTE